MGSQSISDRASQIVWWFISIGLFIGLWELTFAMGLYSAKFLPPPHIFLGDIPNQLQHFDFSKANPGESRRRPTSTRSPRRYRRPSCASARDWAWASFSAF